MYYFLIRLWTFLAFFLSIGIGYVLLRQANQLAELSLMVGCGVGLLLWIGGILLLAALLHPKRANNLFEDRLPPADRTWV